MILWSARHGQRAGHQAADFLVSQVNGLKHNEIGQVIATRFLEFDGKPVRVSLGLPRPDPEAPDFICPYEISGPLTTKAFRIIGVDAVQALQLVLKILGVELEVSAEGKTQRLTWLGGSDTGFAKYVPSDVPGTAGSFTDPPASIDGLGDGPAGTAFPKNEAISMENISLGQVIAIRNLEFDGKPVRVSIGMPQQEQDGPDFLCPYEISGPLTSRLFYAMGVDAVQSLQLVMKMIGSDLDRCAEAKTGRLTWLGEHNRGFPLYAPGTVVFYTDP